MMYHTSYIIMQTYDTFQMKNCYRAHYRRHYPDRSVLMGLVQIFAGYAVFISMLIIAL